jgi:uroporphyrinogen decarboxylase
MKMNPRERISAALNHTEPDRVPIDIGTSDTFIAREVYEGLAALLGLDPVAAKNAPHANTFVTPDEEMLGALGADVRLVPVTQRPDSESAVLRSKDSGLEELLPDGSERWVYADGRIYKRAAGKWDIQLCRPAIAAGLSREEIDRILPPFPQQDDWADAQNARDAIRRWHERGVAVQCNSIIMPVTGTAGGYLDFTSWCLELASQPKLLCDLMDRYLEYAFAQAESFYDAIGNSADTIYGIGDDVASHSGMWMSPRDYRRYIKPRHAKIIRFIKARSKAKIIHHCCGACREIIPDLIEIGVDALNPTQTSAKGMDPFELKRDFGNDIAFWGGIDVMHLLPEGTTQDVEREVKRHIDALAPGGGYVFAPSHIIQRFTPPENVLTMYQTALEYG